jgi:ketosteroid isomerase-like protein
MRTNVGILFLVSIFSAALVFSQGQQISAALASLVEAERAFARACLEKGIRASFTEFFADDGIAFQPQPVNYKETVREQPASLKPDAVTIKWEPIFSDISAAGDMGYNIGPATITDNIFKNRPPKHGFFFSVWKKQPDGQWKVALDLGVDTNEPYTGSREVKTARPLRKKVGAAKVNVEAARAQLMNAERDFLKSAQTSGLVKAFAKHANVDARLHREGVPPMLGREAITQFLAKKAFSQTWETAFADVAQSGDMGYTYGSYEMKEASSSNGVTEKGYYVRVWKSDDNNQWQVVMEVTDALPPEKKKQ